MPKILIIMSYVSGLRSFTFKGHMTIGGDELEKIETNMMDGCFNRAEVVVNDDRNEVQSVSYEKN